MPYTSVLYKKWPRSPSCPPKCPAKTLCQNALQKCPLQKVAPKPKLPSKTPCQNALQKCPL